MATAKDAGELARLWIDCWNRNAPDDIPLAEDFVHTSPFGRVAGRETYLEWVKPLAAQNVTELRIQRVISDGNQAAIHFDMKTARGWVPVCDWVEVADGAITAIHSFYDAAELKQA